MVTDHGRPVARFRSRAEPTKPQVVRTIEAALAGVCTRISHELGAGLMPSAGPGRTQTTSCTSYHVVDRA